MVPSEEMEALADDTVLTDVLDPHAKVRILTVLITNKHRDLNPTEIARLAGIDRSTFYQHIDDLLALRPRRADPHGGNSPMYRINRDSAPAEDPAKMEWDLLDAIPEQE